MPNLQVKLDLNDKQLAKVQKGLPFQLSASQLSKQGNHLINLDRKLGTKFMKAIKNEKGLRFVEGEYEPDSLTQEKQGGATFKSIGKDLVRQGTRILKKKGASNKQINLTESLADSLIDGAGVDEMEGFKKAGKFIRKQANETGRVSKKLVKDHGKDVLKASVGTVIGAPIALATGSPIAGGVGSAIIMEQSGLNKKIDGMGIYPNRSGGSLKPLLGDGNQFIESRAVQGIHRKSGKGFAPFVYSNKTKGDGIYPHKSGSGFLPK